MPAELSDPGLVFLLKATAARHGATRCRVDVMSNELWVSLRRPGWNYAHALLVVTDEDVNFQEYKPHLDERTKGAVERAARVELKLNALRHYLVSEQQFDDLAAVHLVPHNTYALLASVRSDSSFQSGMADFSSDYLAEQPIESTARRLCREFDRQHGR